MEPKINAIKPIDLKQAYQNEVMRGGLPPHMQWYFTFGPNYWGENNPQKHKIITEDIPYEIVENKRLTNGEDKAG